MNKLGVLKSGFSKKISSSKRIIREKIPLWKKRLAVFDKILYLWVILLIGLYRPDIVMMIVYLALYPYLLLTLRKHALYNLIISFGVSLIWMLIAKDEYFYNIKMMVLWEINLFPLFAWSAGLFASYLLYSHAKKIIRDPSIIKKFVLYLAFYWPLLILVEAISYHLFNIQNLASAMYSGLPICECIHAKVWMQIAYLLMGPAYFFICEFVGANNLHFLEIKKKFLKSR